MRLKLRALGTSTAVILPREMLARLRVTKDDALFAIEAPDGYLLTACDPRLQTQLRLGREFMSQYRDAFRALAK